MNNHPISKILERNRNGEHIGLFSVCSSNPIVLRAAIKDAVEHDYSLIIESTANQVNQFGGYTGLHPDDFVALVDGISEEECLPEGHLFLGGDHLGPLTWTDLDEEEAMRNSIELIRSYVLAGYSKIHLDTSMKVKDDGQGPLDVHVCAKRCAALAKEVDAAFGEYKRKNTEALHPVLVIGSEVPIPGGSKEHEDSLTPTDVKDFLNQYNVFKTEFEKNGLDFNDVVAFVVQPGVEFGDDFVIQYDRNKASSLISGLRKTDGIVFEGHSTDYQTTDSLYALVEDGVAVLKVGPAFTFHLREALLLLSEIEDVIVPPGCCSNFKKALLSAMDRNPKYWKKYYSGTEHEQYFKKLYSYSDRARYYLPEKSVDEAVKKLIANLPCIPETILSQYFQKQYINYKEGKIGNDALSVIMDYVRMNIHDYAISAGLVSKQ